jgi:hypothetical protein
VHPSSNCSTTPFLSKSIHFFFTIQYHLITQSRKLTLHWWMNMKKWWCDELACDVMWWGWDHEMTYFPPSNLFIQFAVILFIHPSSDFGLDSLASITITTNPLRQIFPPLQLLPQYVHYLSFPKKPTKRIAWIFIILVFFECLFLFAAPKLTSHNSN